MPSYKTALIGRLFVIRWIGAATISDMRATIDEMSAAAARSKQKLFNVTIVPEGTPTMPSDVRGEVVRQAPVIFESCEAIYNVVEGTGFWAGTMRSMLAGLLLASKMSRGRVHVCSTFEEALAKIDPEIGMDREAALRRARLEGVVV